MDMHLLSTSYVDVSIAYYVVNWHNIVELPIFNCQIDREQEFCAALKLTAWCPHRTAWLRRPENCCPCLRNSRGVHWKWAGARFCTNLLCMSKRHENRADTYEFGEGWKNTENKPKKENQSKFKKLWFVFFSHSRETSRKNYM